jgi:hypothetical protein
MNKNVNWAQQNNVYSNCIPDPVIDAAIENLTANQCEHINKRSHALTIRHVADESHNGGPSEAKGKGTNPLNWGYVDIDPAELNTEVQKREFEHIEAQKIFASKERVVPIAAESLEKNPKEVAQESN